MVLEVRNTQHLRNEIKLNDFRNIYDLTTRLPYVVRVLVAGVLVWLEAFYIEHKVIHEVDRAVKEFDQKVPPESPAKPLYTAKPSDVPGLDDIRLTAPYERTRT